MRRARTWFAAISTAAVVTAGAAARDFHSADVHGRDYPTVRAVEYMGKLISEKTGGRHAIKIFPNSTLGSEEDVGEQLRFGTLDMARLSIATFHGTVPASLVVSYPFIFRDNDHFQKVIRGPVGEEILKSFEPAGFVGLALYDAGARSIYAKKPVTAPADVKGMKIRVIPSDLFAAMIGALGGSAVPIATSEIYNSLKSGLVDGAENNYPTYETMRHYEPAPFYSETQHTRVPEVVVFSKKVWDTLDAGEQAVIREAAKASVDFYQKLWDAKMQASKQALIDNKVVFSAVDRDAFVALEKPVWERFAVTPAARDLVRKIIEVK